MTLFGRLSYRVRFPEPKEALQFICRITHAAGPLAPFPQKRRLAAFLFPFSTQKPPHSPSSLRPRAFWKEPWSGSAASVVVFD